MALLHRYLSFPVSRLARNPIPFIFFFFHSQTDSINHHQVLVEAICQSLRNGQNWGSLSTKFSAVDLTDSVVEKVLLRLTHPHDAKLALGFFHWSAKNKNHRHGVSSYSVAIHILVKARLLVDARALIESVLVTTSKDFSPRFCVVDSLLATYAISCSSPLVFDLLVQGYAKLRFFDVGFDVCRKLKDNGLSLSVITFNCLIQLVQKSDRKDLVWKIYEHMIERRTYPNDTTIKIMISSLCKEGKLKVFIDMLDRIQRKRCSPTVIVNASLIFRVLEEDRIEEGLILLKKLLQKNMILDSIGYSLVVYAKVKLGDLAFARQTFDEMLKRSFDANSFVYTVFIEGYCKKREIEEANSLMQEMDSSGLNPYDETFNILIKGCARLGRVEESLSYCEKMIDKGFVPSCSSFNEMAERLNKIEDVKRANEMLTMMIDKGFEIDERTYSHLIYGYVKGNEIQEAFKLYYEMEYRKISPGFKVFRSLITGLCSCGKVEEGERYFRIMKARLMQPSVELYESLIVGYERNSDKMNAHRIYNEMVSNELKPCKSKAVD